MPEAAITRKYVVVSWFSCIAVFISLLWVSKIYNRQESDKIEFKEWDIATVTASDYTVRMKVKDHFYKNWL